MDNDKPREVLIHPSANRPNQLMGGDRELVLLSAITAVALAFALGSIWGFVLALVFWLSAASVLRRMGKADPLLRQVYMRHIRYRPFYPAKSGLYSECVQPPGNWRCL